MFHKKTNLFLLILISFLPLSCSTSSGPAVNRIKILEETPSASSQQGLAQKDRGSGGDEKAIKAQKEKSTSIVREVTPQISMERTYTSPASSNLPKRDKIRARFPGKKVIFPDELKAMDKKPEYRVGVDDVISVLVWNHPDLSLPAVTVRSDGMISFPLAGNVRVEGLTIPEIEEILKRELTRFLTKPQVTVNPKEMNSQRVFIIGPIRRPYASSTTSVTPSFYIKSGNTLLEALSDVEFYGEADLPASYISRGDTIIPVNIKALLKDGDLSQNVMLAQGDRVVVQSLLKEINVLGEVQSPSRYKVKMDDTLLDALSYAKGVKRETADLYTAYLGRSKQITSVNLKRLLDFGDMNENLTLEDGDVIYIPNIDEKKYYVVGEVAKPGVVYYKDPVDVIEAVAQGGGFLTTAQRKQIVVARGGLRSPQLFEINVLAMLEGQSFERFPLQRGDIVYIPRTLIADWNVFVTQVLPTVAAVALIDAIFK